jgi:hypothetical protein
LVSEITPSVAAIIEPIVPQPSDRVLRKVRHSAFYATALGYLPGRLQTRPPSPPRAVWTGVGQGDVQRALAAGADEPTS